MFGSELVDEIAKLDLQEGDLVVVRMRSGLSPEQAHALAGRIKGIAPNKILIIPFDMKLEKLPESEMNRIGWYRKND